MAATVVKKIRDKLQYGTFLHYLKGRLGKLGLEIYAYYLERESLIPEAELGLSIQPQLSPISVSFLDEHDIHAIYEHPERNIAKEKLLLPGRLSDGCRCFGAKSQGEIVAFTWCDFKQCNHEPLRFPLKEHEVYLFDMYTFKRFRGQNIAPYIRYKLYEALSEMGRTTYYSITDTLNTSSVKFKRKLGAKPAKLYLYVKLLRILEWNLRLKTY